MRCDLCWCVIARLSRRIERRPGERDGGGDEGNPRERSGRKPGGQLVGSVRSGELARTHGRFDFSGRIPCTPGSG